MASTIKDEALVLFAVKFVQPGMLRDIVDGLERLVPVGDEYSKLKEGVRERLELLRERDLVCLYAGRRYMLTKAGEGVVEESGIRHQIEARRMFLLKETRRVMRAQRSGAHSRSLQQGS